MSWNFVPRPFRREAVAHSATEAEGYPTPHAASTGNDTAIEAATQDTLFLTRQAIFDATEKVCAFQLLARSGGLNPEAAPDTAESAARLIVNTLNTFGVAEA